jgi:hypothetical protein
MLRDEQSPDKSGSYGVIFAQTILLVNRSLICYSCSAKVNKKRESCSRLLFILPVNGSAAMPAWLISPVV